MNSSNTKWYKFLYIPQGKINLIIIGLMLAGTMWTGYLTPIKIASLFSSFQKDSFTRDLIELALIFSAQYFFRFFYQFQINRYLQLLVQGVRSLCYGEWIKSYDLKKQGDDHKNEFPLGEVLSRVMNDSESIRELVTSGAFGLLVDLTYVASGMVALFGLNSDLALLVLSCESLCLMLLYLGSSRMAQAFMDLRTTIGKVSREVANLTAGMAQLYFTPSQNFTRTKANLVFDHFFQKQLKINNYDAIFYSAADGLFAVLLVVVALGLSWFEATDLAFVAVIIDQIQRAIGPMKGFAGKISNFQRAFTGIRRMQEFIEEHQRGFQSHHDHIRNLEKVENLEVEVKLFQYPERNKQENTFQLRNISFSIRPGKTVGLVGQSGCGKSTLFSILCGDLWPQEGSLKLKTDKKIIDLKDGKPGEYLIYRDHVALITQDSHVFTESLAFNLSMGERNAQDQELQNFWAEMKLDCPYLVDWGLNLETKIFPSALSAGQKQVVALLRAFFLKRDIILLDEISSGMDSKLEMALRKITKKIQSHAMVLVVAHRLETVIDADEILVMENGQILGRGRHQELLEKISLYAKLIEDFKS